MQLKFWKFSTSSRVTITGKTHSMKLVLQVYIQKIGFVIGTNHWISGVNLIAALV